MSLHPSEIERNEAERDHLLAQARKETALAEKEEAQAEVAKLVRDREQEKRCKELAANDLHRVYVFDKEVSESSVKACIQQLTTWSRQDPECPIQIDLNSPGGSIFDGLALVDFLRDLRERGHKLTIVALGCAASMAGVILQAADERVMGANALMLIHEGSLGAIGDFGKVEDRVALMGIFHQRILSLFEERAKPINPKTTKAFIKRNWERRDWWLTAQTALGLGLIDTIR